MNSRFKILGVFLMIAGLAFVAVGGYTYVKTQEGSDSLKAIAAAQNVKLTYNDAGQLANAAGETEEAQAIMGFLTKDWGYPAVASDFNPKDPIVNTASEYMYQLATVTYHTLNAKTTVTIPKDVTLDDGTVVKAGDYDFVNDGKYWTGFDRSDPIQAAARDKVWTGTAHGLIAELGVGTVTATTLQIGLGIAGVAGAMGGTLLLFGFGLVWAASGKRPE